MIGRKLGMFAALAAAVLPDAEPSGRGGRGYYSPATHARAKARRKQARASRKANR